MKQIQRHDFEHRLSNEAEISRMQREENDFKKMRLGEVLKQQMKDNDSKRLNDTKERREKILTSGGPEQTSESMQDMKNRLANQRTLTKHEL